MQIIRSFNTGGVKYYDPSITRLPGEWILINCGKPWLNATLSFAPQTSFPKDPGFSPLDKRRIKSPFKNAFNITRLEYNDSGYYWCQFPPWDARTQTVDVLKEGKTCIHH
jgi:hypothetical protein